VPPGGWLPSSGQAGCTERSVRPRTTGRRTGGRCTPVRDGLAWAFYGSAYASKYLSFVPVETRSDVLISRTASPQSMKSYTELQKLTAAQQAILGRYDKARGVPFLDFGDKYVLVGSSFLPMVLAQQTWSQIAATLRNGRNMTGQAILGTANYITAAICRLTGDQPASACTPTVRSLLGPGT